MRLRPPRIRRLRGFQLLSLPFLVSVGVTSFFLIMVFLLWRREAGQRYAVTGLGISPDLLVATWIDYEQWMWVERSGERLGIYRLQIRRDEETDTYDMVVRTRLELDAFGRKLPVDLDALVHMGNRFELKEFQGQLQAAGQKIEADAFADALELYLDVRGPALLLPGGALTAYAGLDRPVMMADAILPLVSRNRQLKVGSRWRTEASDPFTGQARMIVEVQVEARETIEIDGEPREAFRVVEKAGEAKTTSWYSPEGRLLRTDLGNGMVMIAAGEKEAEAAYRELRRAPRFAPIDRERIRKEAKPLSTESGSLIPWLPNL